MLGAAGNLFFLGPLWVPVYPLVFNVHWFFRGISARRLYDELNTTLSNEVLKREFDSQHPPCYHFLRSLACAAPGGREVDGCAPRVKSEWRFGSAIGGREGVPKVSPLFENERVGTGFAGIQRGRKD